MRPRPLPNARRSPTALLGLTPIVMAVALVAGCGSGASEDPATTGTRAVPIKASADALRTVASVVDHPVFWVTGQTPATYELTQTADGRIYIRYLPKDVALGDPRPNFLTVGTYPQTDAFATIGRAAKRSGAVATDLAEGGLMVAQPDAPTSVFFATPKSTVIVEVFDPTARRAATLVTAGAVRPIE